MTILQYIKHASVGLGILVFLVIIINNIVKKKEFRLDNILLRVLAGSMIPTGFVLVFCAFDTSLVAKLEGLNIHIAVAGLALIYLSVKSLLAKD